MPDRRRPVAIRAATTDDLDDCGRIWRDAINAYLVRLNQPQIPPELAGVRRLHAHAQATDPERFLVATRDDAGGREVIVGFGSAVAREASWFLSMLFVEPAEQGRGIGRALLDRLLPPTLDGWALATATDSLQPISNGLYASLGIVPRMPLYSLTGRPASRNALPPLPDGVEAIPFETLAGGPPDGPGHRALAETFDALDRELLGYAHPEDHRYLRAENRIGYLFRRTDGTPVGYGYTSALGRIGPVASRDPELLPAILGALLWVIEPRGASAIWVPGAMDGVYVSLLRAGFRLDGFPILVCWSKPFADFARYIPISPGLP